MGAGGAGGYYAMTDEARRNLGSNPNGATNDYSALSRQMHAPGLGAQADMLEMYRAQALGQGPPSAAQQQLAESAAQQQRFASQMGGQAMGGNLAGAYGQAMQQQAGTAQNLASQQQMLQAAQMQQALQGYAGLGIQMQQQGLGYDQLNQQQLMGMQGLQTDWYLGGRQADMAQQQANQEFNMGMLKAGAGLLGGITGAASGMGGR